MTSAFGQYTRRSLGVNTSKRQISWVKWMSWIKTVDPMACRVAEVSLFRVERKRLSENGAAIEKASVQALSITKGESHRGSSVYQHFWGLNCVPWKTIKSPFTDHQTLPNKMSLFYKEMGGLPLCTLEDLISKRVWVFQVSSLSLCSEPFLFVLSTFSFTAVAFSHYKPSDVANTVAKGSISFHV